MNKQQIRQFLKNHNMKPDELSTLAGVGRWSLRRFLENSKASITLRTADKLNLAMFVIEKEADGKTSS